MRLKSVTYLLVLLAIMVVVTGCGTSSTSQKATAKHPREVKVALSAEVNPPYLYTNKNNDFVGLDMDYMKMLEKKLPQYKFKYELGEE